MANKAISELPQALNVNNQDLFVLEQSGIAKKLTAETFITEQGIIDALAEALDGHGGISSVTLSSVSGRIRTYLITFTDETTTTFQVLDGTSIDRITKTSTAGLTDTYTIFMNDGTTTFFTVTNGADGTVSEEMLNDALKDKAPAVTETTESSAIANFTDGADDLVMHNIATKIEPVQDLHGQDSPYPPGGGKNLLPDKFYNGGGYNQAVGTTFTLTELQDVTKTGDDYSRSVSSWGGMSMLSNQLAAGTYKVSITYSATSGTRSTLYVLDETFTVSQTIANSSVNGTWTNSIALSATEKYIFVWLGSNAAVTVKFSNPMITAGSSSETFAPYSNICSITGWTGVNVYRTGKNLFDSSLLERINNNVFRSSTFPLKAGSYIFSRPSADNSLYSWYVRSVQGSSFTNEATGGESVASKAFTLTEDSTMYLEFYKSSGIADNAIKNIQIEVGSTATAYEPYITPATVSLSWQDEAGTVYGGTIDVATGLLTVTHAMQLMTGASSEGWNLWTGKFVASISGIARSGSTSSNNKIIIADRFKSNGVQYRDQCQDGQIIKVIDSNNYIACYSSVYTDINAFTASLGTNPMTVVYKLATSQTYQLSGQQLKTLLGMNNVWATTGNVSVTYTADTKMFIEKLTMPTEDDLVANQAITSGKFFMVGNNLYIATAAIASGAKIIEGTNATRLSLADALNRL